MRKQKVLIFVIAVYLAGMSICGYYVIRDIQKEKAIMRRLQSTHDTVR